MMDEPGADAWATHAIDPAAMRHLELHEARCHAIGSRRQVRDLSDAVLLHDPDDLEPFWNRVAAVRFPSEARAFRQRLDALVRLFGTLGRRPHIWGSPLHNSPSDLGRRLEAEGFVDVGGGLLMILTDGDRALDAPTTPRSPDVRLERINRPDGALGRATIASELALVLSEAFDLEPGRRTGLAAETAAALQSDEVSAFLARVDGEPAAVAKCSTFGGATYLSSIGTRPAFRGRGLGTLVTAAATREGIEAGSRWTYLGVMGENRTARHVYEGLGYEILGGVAGDYLLP
jgi:ribosomal protein S18 acetylase RimI-like enzyme